MSSNLAGNPTTGSTPKASVHVGKRDVKKAEKLGVANKSVSTVYTDAMDKWVKLDEIRREKARILEKETTTLQDLLNLWNMVDIEK